MVWGFFGLHLLGEKKKPCPKKTRTVFLSLNEKRKKEKKNFPPNRSSNCNSNWKNDVGRPEAVFGGNSDVPLNAKLIIKIPFRSISNQISQFPLGANVHPPKRKTTTQPPPLGPPALWPYSGCVKMWSCIPPLVSFLDLCIFALIRKL